MAAANASMTLMVSNLAIGAKILLKSTPSTCKCPFATNLALKRTKHIPLYKTLIWTLRPCGVHFHVPLAMRYLHSS